MLLALFLRFGYAMVLVAAAVEGDATLLTATFLAHRGYLRLPLGIVAAALGTVIANQVYFWLARTLKEKHRAKQYAVPARVSLWISRYGLPLVMASRFIYGFRIAITAACGAGGMAPWRFLLADIVGAFVWAATIGVAGYAIGQLLEQVVDDLRRYEWWVALAILSIALAALFARGREWPSSRLLNRAR